MKNKHLLLIDGNSIFFKAFYASYFRLKRGEELTDDGTPINAIRLFAFMIINLKKRYPNADILVAFDARGLKTYRHEYDYYKATRKKQPDELYQQIPLAKEFLDLLGIKWLEDDKFKKYEADDIIGIYAYQAKKSNYLVDIVSSDKDLLQLVDENINVHLSKTGITNMIDYTNSNFFELFHGLSPSQIPDLKGLAGDASDNIEGIKGIGEKTAVKLLKKYYSLERVIEHIDELKGSLKEKIINGKDKGIESKKLAKIIEIGDLKANLNNLTVKEKNANLEKWLEDKKLFNVIEHLKK